MNKVISYNFNLTQGRNNRLDQSRKSAMTIPYGMSRDHLRMSAS